MGTLQLIQQLGSPTDGPDGVWDSSLMMVGGNFMVLGWDSYIRYCRNIPYFCMVHPWMEGVVIVEDICFFHHTPADGLTVPSHKC